MSKSSILQACGLNKFHVTPYIFQCEAIRQVAVFVCLLCCMGLELFLLICFSCFLVYKF